MPFSNGLSNVVFLGGDIHWFQPTSMIPTKTARRIFTISSAGPFGETRPFDGSEPCLASKDVDQ